MSWNKISITAIKLKLAIPPQTGEDRASEKQGISAIGRS
jgi:hypothetical protein